MDEIELEAEPTDETTSADLLREKDQIRASASDRERLRLLLESVDQEQAAEAQAAPQAEQAPQAPPEEERSALRHISPIEAIGGAVESARDLFETAQDMGAGVASAMGATDDELAQAKQFASASSGLLPLLEKLEIGDPESGSMIREIANFATSFMGAGKLKPLQSLAGMGKAGAYGSVAARGFLADFVASDPEDGRAVDAAEGTRFDNPVFDILQTEEGEGALERRLKQSVEGVGMGLAFDTVVVPALRMAGKGVRTMTAARKTLDVVEEADKAVAMQREAVVESMGDPSAPLVSRVGGREVPRDIITSQKALDRTLLATDGQPQAAELAMRIRGESDYYTKEFIPLSEVRASADEMAGVDHLRAKPEKGAILIGRDGRIIDGRHRYALALHEGADKIEVYKPIDPPSKISPGGEPGGVKINFARIESSDDVKTAIRELADSYSDSIGAAQRGVRSHEVTKAAAAEEDAFKLLMDTGSERGITMNAEETFAMRELWVASGRKVRELADKVGSDVATPIDELAFRRQMAVHSAIQERVLAVRTETARALNQWRIPAGDTLEFSAEFDQMVASMGATSGGYKRMAKAIKEAADAGRIDAAEQLVYGSRWAKTADMGTALYYFSMLSGPHTHMRNLLSNTLMIGVSASERKLANLIGRSFGDEQVVTGETTAMLNGIFEGSREAFRITSLGRQSLKRAKEARKLGRPDEVRRILEEAGDEVGTFHKARVSGESGYGVNKVESSPISAFSPEKLGIEQGRSPMGDFLYHTSRLMDAVTTMPTRALSAGDEVAKTINARMELNALAYRQAAKDVADGVADDFGARYADLVMSPDKSMQLLSRETAERNTFTNRPLDSNSWKAVSSIARIPVVGKLLMPFVRTPYNLATQSFRRTPLAIAVRSWREDLMAGGARTDIALAQFAGGTAAMATFADMTLRGSLTGRGPSNHKERATLMRQGWQPYSLKIGDTYYSYRGLEPISTLIGISADAVETIAHMDFDDEDVDTDELVTAVLFSTMSQIQNKTYLQGLADFFNAASDDTFALSQAGRMLERKAGLVSPAIVSHLNRAGLDNQAREVNGMIEAIQARTPGLSDNLNPRRDVWGRPISFGSNLGGLYDFVSPLYASELNPEPIDLELQDIEVWLTKPRRKTKIGGENVNLGQFPDAYDDLVRLAGNDLTHDQFGAPVDPMTEMGLKDSLNALVTGQHPLSSVYQMHNPEDRGEMILDMQRRFLDAAKAKVAADHPELGAVVDRKREEREAEQFNQLQQFGN